jgi:integrase
VSITRRPDGRWRARYRDPAGSEHSRHFARKVDGQRWLDEVTTAVVSGRYVDPQTARKTVEQWCATWLTGYGTRRGSTVRQAEVHVAQIRTAFGAMQLQAVRPSLVKAWTARLKADGLSDSYVYALHSRLAQIMADAVLDGIITRNPCSRRTSPGAGSQRPYVATTEQVWALYEAVPEHLAPAVLLGAFAGLRTAEVCGLLVTDVDFMRGIVYPARQWGADDLKTELSDTPIPVPAEMSLALSAAVAAWPGSTLVTDGAGGPTSPWAIQRAIRSARRPPKLDKAGRDVGGIGLPDGFRFHDLRHYFASVLIASGADVKVVQARLRHASAKTTLDTYGHLWPDADESARAAVGAVFAARADSVRTKRSS